MSENDQAELRGDIINHSEVSDYVVPKEAAVRDKLEWFQDQKFALMVHWGAYSELGMCESWPLSEEDAVWSRKEYQWEKDPETFRQQYVSLNKSFNPLRFVPDEWASFAKEAGFRYFIFTTKHHDGFCMYDSKYSDYKVTAPDCPFHTHKYRNIAKELFDAFRKEGIAIAPYFSKPDWHCPWYWAQGQKYPVAHWRNPTYDPTEKPEIWNQFVEYTHNQLTEIAEDLGPVDILWLDGGQVRPQNGQNIRLMELADKLRQKNPGLILADRTVGGETENYITPEQQVPDHLIPVPWESCVTIGRSFAFSYEDDLKSLRQLVHLLVDVVGKGGNLALNIGAQPDGRLPVKARERALELGAWLNVNGEAIFGTRALAPYFAGDWSFTQNKDNRFAILRLPEGENLPRRITVPLDNVTHVSVVGCSDALQVETLPGCAVVTLPDALSGTSPCALALKLNK
ncbi:MAG: alpha-L-fucosidase [Clostridiales bacterium]|nr:alpha-L-fucosidase [Clostridiales bacterium]